MTIGEHRQVTECNQCAEWRADVVRLMQERKTLRDALQEILDEATGDFDRDAIITAAQGALKEAE